jgi:hypothetical protein
VLCFFGRIVYEDMFPKDDNDLPHETRWCYAYLIGKEPRLISSGPQEYREKT